MGILNHFGSHLTFTACHEIHISDGEMIPGFALLLTSEN